MPVPMMAPIPRVVRSVAVRTRLRPCSPPLAASARMRSIDLVANNDIENPPDASGPAASASCAPEWALHAAKTADYTRTSRTAHRIVSAVPAAPLRAHGAVTPRRSAAGTRALGAGRPSASRSLMTTTASAPAAITSGAVSSVMPPIATRDRPPCASARRRASETSAVPTGAYPVALVCVPNTGPTAM